MRTNRDAILGYVIEVFSSQLKPMQLYFYDVPSICFMFIIRILLSEPFVKQIQAV